MLMASSVTAMIRIPTRLHFVVCKFRTARTGVSSSCRRAAHGSKSQSETCVIEMMTDEIGERSTSVKRPAQCIEPDCKSLPELAKLGGGRR
jgi:hypothetical protein